MSGNSLLKMIKQHFTLTFFTLDLSTPSPSNIGSPSFTNSSLNSPASMEKSENENLSSCLYETNLKKPQNQTISSCLYDNKPKTQLNRFLSSVSPFQHQQQQNMKQCNSVPENINMIGTSPSATPFGSLGNSSYGGSATNLHDTSFNETYGNLNQSSSLGSLTQLNPKLLSSSISNNSLNCRNSPTTITNKSKNSLTNIPDEFRNSPTNLPNDYRNSPTNLVNSYYNPASPMSIGDDTLPMDLETVPVSNFQNNSLNWLDLNIEPSSPPQYQNSLLQPKEMLTSHSFPEISNSMRNVNPNSVSPLSLTNNNTLYNNSNTLFINNQTSLYGSPKHNNGFVSLFDLENGEY